jgi:hypothetical protein
MLSDSYSRFGVTLDMVKVFLAGKMAVTGRGFSLELRRGLAAIRLQRRAVMGSSRGFGTPGRRPSGW